MGWRRQGARWTRGKGMGDEREREGRGKREGRERGGRGGEEREGMEEVEGVVFGTMASMMCTR